MIYNITKRTMDLAGAILLLIIFSPVLIATAILIKLSSEGPILVEKENKHMKRVGRNKKMFRLFKSRKVT